MVSLFHRTTTVVDVQLIKNRLLNIAIGLAANNVSDFRYYNVLSLTDSLWWFLIFKLYAFSIFISVGDNLCDPCHHGPEDTCGLGLECSESLGHCICENGTVQVGDECCKFSSFQLFKLFTKHTCSTKSSCNVYFCKGLFIKVALYFVIIRKVSTD